MKPSACFSLLLTSAIVFLTTGCTPGRDGAETQTLHAQWSGPHSSAETPAKLVVRTADEWIALWQRIGSEPPRPLAASNEIAVAVFLGERRTGGYSVEFARLRSSGSTLVIEYLERTPPGNTAVPQVLTSPWAVGILDATLSPIDFIAVKAPAGAKP